MTDMVMRLAEQPAGVGALPPHIDIDAEITALEAHLARLLAVREAQTVEDATPWVLDHSDDEWVSSPGVGASAFNRRARQAGLLTAAEEVTLPAASRPAPSPASASPPASSCAAPSAAVSSTWSAPPTKPASG